MAAGRIGDLRVVPAARSPAGSLTRDEPALSRPRRPVQFRWRRLWSPSSTSATPWRVLGRFPALAGADLDVERGEIVLLRGPNGAGKTTLLRLCAGLLPVGRGEAVVLGHDLRRTAATCAATVGLLGHATASTTT